MTDAESCYFAALIDALRLIAEREKETGVPVGEIDPAALYDYVQAKGKQIAIANDIGSPAPTIAVKSIPRAALCSKSHGRHCWGGENVCRCCGADFFEVWMAKQERAQLLFAPKH